jgi:hypothetical protein
MSRNMANFVPMAGPVRQILEVLESEIGAECGHRHKKVCAADESEGGCPDPDHGVFVEGLEEAAVAVADLIERGELR